MGGGTGREGFGVRGALLVAALLAACHQGQTVVPAPTLQDPPPPVPAGASTPVGSPPQVQAAPPEKPLDPTPVDQRPPIAKPLEGVYTDKGAAEAKEPIRGLLGLPIRDQAALEERVRAMYTPGGPDFRRYFAPQELIDAHAPFERDVQVVSEWLVQNGLKVHAVSKNRLFIYFEGTAGAFNKAFGVTLRILSRKSPQIGNPNHDVLGLNEGITVPTFIAERTTGVVTLDLQEFDGRELPPEATPPPGLPKNLKDGYTPEQIAHGYNLDALWAQGFRGQGQKLGVIVGGSYHLKDTRGFWKAFGINRADPVNVDLLEAPRLRIREANLDVQWAGAMAPDAELLVYRAPDARNTSMIFVYNELLSIAEVSVLTDSFAHREDSEPRLVRRAYSDASLWGAANGITIAAASGDSAGVDVPSNSPYVTAVGGTLLGMDGNTRKWEIAWEHSGSGISLQIDRPFWQEGLTVEKDDGRNKRAVVDLALNSGMGMWYVMLGKWYPNIGTSFASPIFAGMMAVVNSARAAQGKPHAGFLNQNLYTMPEVQGTFRDITDGYTSEEGWGGTPKYRARKGWDIPTGWGAPDAEGLVKTLP
jgi:kumamolisin